MNYKAIFIAAFSILCGSYALCAAPVKTSAASDKAVILWPQLTDGIYNHANELAMKCVVADDGLTVTDQAWDSYQRSGCLKRWRLNEGAHIKTPLKNYKFPAEYAGLPITITVEIYSADSEWTVKETYQEIIQLGGKQKIGLPAWFHVPSGRLGYDFDEGAWFPSGWTMPRGKYALWQGAGKARQVDRKGACPMYDFGFTHVSPIGMSHNGNPGTREKRAHLFTDNEWITYNSTADKFNEPSNPKSWNIEPFFHYADTCSIITPDFEMPNYLVWGNDQYDAFTKMINDTRARKPDVRIGCWGVGVVNSSFRIFDKFWEGKPTGVVDLDGAKQWRERYNNAAANIHPVYSRCNLNYGNPSVYWTGHAKPSQLYAFMQEWEEAKLAKPNDLSVMSTWIQVEFVDGYPLSQYRFTDANGKVRNENIKHQVPASQVYALSLFGHCVMDGLQCWDVGSVYSEDVSDYADWNAHEPSIKRTINGVETPVVYYIKYFGFYNYHVLGMWQASQNKDIIDAPTKWEMPELMTDTNGAWRVGDERYPSYANFYKEPLARVKLSANGKTLLVIACNPYNLGVQQLHLRLPGGKEEFTVQLVGDFPVIKRFPVKGK